MSLNRIDGNVARIEAVQPAVGEQPPPSAPKEPTFAEAFSNALSEKIILSTSLCVYHVLKVQKHFRKYDVSGKPPLEVAKLDFYKESVLNREIPASGVQRKTDLKRAICEEAVEMIQTLSDSGESNEDYSEFRLTQDQKKRFSEALKADLLNRYELIGSEDTRYVCSFRDLKQAKADADMLLQLLPFGAKILEQLGFPLDSVAVP